MAKELVAMLLAGGQGSRLYALTQKLAKPAVPFGGKYRIIDFPLSNCVNSGIDTVGILTQYQPFVLNEYDRDIKHRRLASEVRIVRIGLREGHIDLELLALLRADQLILEAIDEAAGAEYEIVTGT